MSITTMGRPGGKLARILLAGAIIAGAMGALQLAVPEAAQAATTGAGIEGITPFGGYLGNYIMPDGSRAYCIDSSADWPSGSTSGGDLVDGLSTAWGAGLSALQISRMNYALTKWGQTADPVLAAAVNAYLYAYTSTYAQFNGQGYAAGTNYINGNADVLADYNVIWSESESYNGPPTNGGSGVLNIVMTNGYDGYLTVTTNPTTAVGAVTISGATFASTGTTTATITNGVKLPIKGIPFDDTGKYRITADATFTAPGGPGAAVTLYTTPGQQRTINGGGASNLTFTAAQFVSDPIDTDFSPTVGTQVASKFVQPGDSFVDTIEASVAAGSNPWRTRLNGTPYAVVAQGTLYGPFTEQPSAAATAPAGAPVVGTESITLSGPGTYQSSGSLTAPDAGFYTWVWSIAEADQSAITQLFIPDGYAYADQFGLVAETHVVPIDLSAVSEASTSSVGLSGGVSDQLTVLLNSGQWLTANGAPIPAVFNGTAYFVAGDTSPAVSTSVPAGAIVLGSATITANGSGVYPASSPVTAPTATAGYITWVWSLDPSSSYGAYFQDWTDQFGLPAETTRVEAPGVGTQATPVTAIGDPVSDTAFVSGTVPAATSHLVFTAYLQPEAGEATCDASNLVYDSSSTPVEVTTVGTYQSPVTKFDSYGTYFWVETLYSSDDQVISRGICGDEGETTVVSEATVTTKAVEAVVLGSPAHDVAIVGGQVPTGSYLTFAAYFQASPGNAVCDATTREFASTNENFTAGAGEYPSPDTTFSKVGTYFWIETLYDRTGKVLSEGECGAAGETTLVTPPSLAHTGLVGIAGANTPLVYGAIAAVVLGFIGLGAAGLVWTRRRRLTE